jgi:hypothetical protein
MKRLLVIDGWTIDGFTNKVNHVLADPNIDVISTTYFNSWGVHYAYIEYEMKEPREMRE